MEATKKHICSPRLFALLLLQFTAQALHAIRDDGRKSFPTLVVQLCLIVGLIAIVIGPAGGLAVSVMTSLTGWVFFVILPLACVVRLIARAKDYVLGHG